MKVSIITVTYNRRTTIEGAIRSVLEQDYPDIELLVVDGRSTDGTLEVVRALLEHEANEGATELIRCHAREARLMSEPDRGMYEALNKGVRLATGDVLGCVHSDDELIHTSVISQYVSCFEQTGADMVYADGVFVSQKDPRIEKRLWVSGDYRRWKVRLGWLPLHPTVYLRRAAIDYNVLYDEQYHMAADTKFLIYYLHESPLRVCYMPQFVIRMRMGGLSTLPQNSLNMFAEDVKIYEDYGFGHPRLIKLMKMMWKVPQFVNARLRRLRVALSLWLALCLAFLTLVGCSEPLTQVNVLTVWPTDASDPVYQQWSVMLKEEFERHGYAPQVYPLYLENDRLTETERQTLESQTIQQIRNDDIALDLILAYGDEALHATLDNADPQLRLIPTVAYGLRLTARYVSLVDSLEAVKLAQRPMYALICDSIDLKASLDFGALLFPDCRHFISCLDPYSSHYDQLLHQYCIEQMQHLDQDSYLSNLDLRLTADEVSSDTMHITYYSLSLRHPETNWSPDFCSLHSVAWAFYVQKSGQHFLQAKHDAIARELSEQKNLPPYLTMVPEDFGMCDSCIGGYMTPAEVLLADAVQVGTQLLQGKTAAEISLRTHQKRYVIDWDVIRPEDNVVSSQMLASLPKQVEVFNVKQSDRHPHLYYWLIILSDILILIVLLASVYGVCLAVKKHRKRSRSLKETARRAIQTRELSRLALEGAEAFLWTDPIQTFSESHFHTNEYFRQQLSKFLAIMDPGDYEMQCQASIDGGTMHWYDIRMAVKGQERKGMVVPIDELKKMESDTLESQRMLAMAKEREAFLISMSHQLRTPLNAIVGFSQVLAMPGNTLTDEEVALYSSYIEDNNLALMKIIDDMLTITLMEHSNTLIEPAIIYASQLIDRHAVWDGAMQALKLHRVHLFFELGPSDARFRADWKALCRVMGNLIDNAAKFSTEGSAIYTGWRVDSEQNVILYVRDHGIGISEEHKKMIFERFYKVNNFVAGAGLGLTLSRELIERMGGSLCVESQLGKGSTFYVKLKMISEE